jgi:hypothetical protein
VPRAATAAAIVMVCVCVCVCVWCICVRVVVRCECVSDGIFIYRLTTTTTHTHALTHTFTQTLSHTHPVATALRPTRFKLDIFQDAANNETMFAQTGHSLNGTRMRMCGCVYEYVDCVYVDVDVCVYLLVANNSFAS